MFFFCFFFFFAFVVIFLTLFLRHFKIIIPRAILEAYHDAFIQF